MERGQESYLRFYFYIISGRPGGEWKKEGKCQYAYINNDEKELLIYEWRENVKKF